MEKNQETHCDDTRIDLDRQIRDAFRERQQQKKARQVQHLVLGKGLGAPAESTLVDGYYNPQKVLEPLTAEEKELWETIDLRRVPLTSDEAGFHFDDHDSVADSKENPPADPNDGLKEPEEQPFLEKLRCTYSPVKAILQARAEIDANIATAENELNSVCRPFQFSEVLDSLVIALEVLEEGNTTAQITLPTYCREEPSPDERTRAAQREAEKANPLYLAGAYAVLQHTREHLFPIAHALVPVTHTAQWVVQYTVAFLRSLTAFSDEEAQVRLELLARCIRLVGRTEQFSSVLLLLEAKAEEYDAFHALQESAETHIGALLDDVERTLDSILKQPFPSRRSKLRLVEKGIKQKLQRTLLFLNEIDYHWTPNVRCHAMWKAGFLSNAFYRIHCVVSPRFARCLLGFIDDAVYKLVSDTRISGRLLGASPVQPQVPMARQVEYERVTEGLTLQQIGMHVKHNASILVGAQVCMSARFVVRQSTKEFNEQWGFAMDEVSEGPSTKEVKSFMAGVTSKARSRIALLKTDTAAAGPPKPPPHKARPPRAPTHPTFLTQNEDD